MRKVVALIAVIFFILPSHGEAMISLGSVSDSRSTVYSSLGGDVQLKYSFFNTGDENLNLRVSYELLNDGTRYDLQESGDRVYMMNGPYPSTMRNTLYITLPPMTLDPDSSPNREWIALDGGTSYAEVKSAYLFVRIPGGNIHANPYRLKVAATTLDASDSSDAQNTTSIQKVVQQREYLITIYNGAEKVELVPDTIDSDNDGLTDSDELDIYNTNPYKRDTDGDGITDGDEIKRGTDPNDPDSPGGRRLSSSSFFGKLGDMIGLGGSDPASTGPDQSGSEVSRDDAGDEKRTDTGEEADNTGETDETAGENVEETGNPTGLASKIPSTGPVNIATVIIVFIGALFIYRLLKIKVY